MWKYVVDRLNAKGSAVENIKGRLTKTTTIGYKSMHIKEGRESG